VGVLSSLDQHAVHGARELGVKLVEDRATINDFIVERVEPLIEN
jgi:hypothetical protein